MHSKFYLKTRYICLQQVVSISTILLNVLYSVQCTQLQNAFESNTAQGTRDI